MIRPADRMPKLMAQQKRKMAASANAYVRGSTARFYEWLEDSDRRKLPQGPPIWICGDCHVGNLGPVASADGELAIEIRDFDQTVIGNPAHDLIRLGLSLAMGARGVDLPGVTTVRMLESMMQGYEAAFTPRARGKAADETTDMPKTVQTLMRQAAGRSWKHLADERIEGTEPVIPLGKRFWPLSRKERSAINALFEQDDTRHLVRLLRAFDDDAPLRMLDAAYWRKGCSSLGRLRLAVLVAVGKGKAERHCLMDIKQAVTAAAPHDTTIKMPTDDAERVITGAEHLSPFLGGRMLATKLLGRSVFMRALLPQDLKVEVERLTSDEAVGLAAFLAHVVGRGHARQLDAATRKRWAKTLQASRSKSLDAPSWLWNSVVDLIALHEAAYLEHCRNYTLVNKT
ncbi:MAG TPA: DUF2252 family protein [Rhodopila sp.]|jgi:uncharacterized protein (DUF2252 family)